MSQEIMRVKVFDGRYFIILFSLLLILTYITNPTMEYFDSFIESQSQQKGIIAMLDDDDEKILSFMLSEHTYRYDYKLFSIFHIDIYPHTVKEKKC